jgi:membrane protein
MMRNKISWKNTWRVLKRTVKQFGTYNLPRHSAALSYYTIFSFAPLLVVLIAIGSFFFSPDIVQGKVNATMAGFLGDATARELQEVVAKASLQGKSRLALIIGGATLLFAATTVFGQIQESLNAIWGVRARARRGWFRLIMKRLLSFAILATLGFILLVSLAISALLDSLGTRLQDLFPGATAILAAVINTLVVLLVITLIFAVIFRFLPDTRTPWRDIWGGAVITGVLFVLGKYAISVYLSRANIGATYGTAGAIVILLVWVYYSSMILYFGAAITRNWVEIIGEGIEPDADSATVEVIERETGRRYRSS